MDYRETAHSCGVFALKFAECILEGKAVTFVTSTRAIHNMRVDIATTLLRESDTLQDLCHHCGSEDSDDPQWIGCDISGRWYHNGCVKSPALDEE
ncbi:hypothetical protein SKAU_G00273450 [Synaphobranchus kaupii]|uniref:Uncharacterized protein n=1 Tax=Synaphobranchus kaupii TaxID=118154 RepID=A0A9Q1F0T7_SYNKA|nr:hypothetical protein SKAU_G00273450 [Synaphobranchus kaupii]